MQYGHIYGIIDPRTQELFYIGRTLNAIETRMAQHVYKAMKGASQSLNNRKIRQIVHAGMYPDVFEIEALPIDRLVDAEGAWTEYFRYIGANLSNENSHRAGYNQKHMKGGEIWTEEAEMLLGTMVDSEVAKILGLPKNTVNNKRKDLGIKSFSEQQRPQFRYSTLHARSVFKTHEKEIEEKLGKVSDVDLAREYGISPDSIARRRIKLNIPACPQYNYSPPPVSKWNMKTLPENIISQLGTMGDRPLAKIAGVDPSVIQREREARNIPNWTVVNNHPTRFHNGPIDDPQIEEKRITNLRIAKSSLTLEQVAIIKFNAYNLKTQVEYARMFHIGQTTVKRIRNGITYQEITEAHLPSTIKVETRGTSEPCSIEEMPGMKQLKIFDNNH